jgi:DNA-binding PadR family transcriptional regulator
MKKRASSAESLLPLRPNWFHILLSLRDQEQHGYGIMQDVLERTDGKVRLWPTTLYGTLKRMIDDELIEESDERPAPEMDDARRIYYRLTKFGARVLAAETQRLQDLINAAQAKKPTSKREATS